MNNITWSTFLLLMVGPGVNSGVGLLLSGIVEYLPKYNDLAPKWKRLVFAGLSLVVPLTFTALAIAIGEFGQWGDWQTTWWPALVAGASAAFAGTVAHTRKL